jgi:hypothetical protein
MRGTSCSVGGGRSFFIHFGVSFINMYAVTLQNWVVFSILYGLAIRWYTFDHSAGNLSCLQFISHGHCAPPSWCLWRKGRAGRERETERRNNGSRHKTMRHQTAAPFPSPLLWPLCVVLTQNSKRVSSNGGVLCLPLGTEVYCTWAMRVFRFRLDLPHAVAR